MQDVSPRSRASDKETSLVFRESVLGFEMVEIVGHALERMKERGISTEEVIATLKNPDETGLPTQAGRKRVRRNKTSGSAIEVAYEEYKDRIRVITVMRAERRIAKGR
jgi:hypothetical protein